MDNMITWDNLSSFAYLNDKICKKPIRGIAIDFFGLGGQEMYLLDTQAGRELAALGILLLIPYNNPWAWMNRQAVSFTDELLDVIFRHFTLRENTPIISTGGSMGGLSALVYTRYAKRTPVACVANCPVCDLPFHYTERPDLPRTLYSAFFQYDGNLEEALRSASPLHLVPQMPDVDYYLFHCEEDKAVNIRFHSEKFVEAMRPAHRISLTFVPGRDHCDLTKEAAEQYRSCITESVAKYAL